MFEYGWFVNDGYVDNLSMMVMEFNLKTQFGKLESYQILCFHKDETSVCLSVKNESDTMHVDVGSWPCLFEVGCMDF